MKKNLVKILLVLLPILLLITSVYGCSRPVTTSQENITTKLFIWKVTSDTTQVYLLGSVHVAKKDLYPLDNTIENAFNDAKYLVVEVNTSNITPAYSLKLMDEYGTYTNGTGFEENVSPELYDKLDTYLQKHGMPLNLFDDFRPFIIFSLVTAFQAMDVGYNPEYGIDMHYSSEASKSKKEIKELETYEFQMNLLSSISDEIMIATLEDIIDNPNMEKELQDLFDAWQKGDTAQIEATTFASTNETEAAFIDAFITKRNYTMVEKIEEYLADNEIYFVVVGAAHMVGEEGIVNLLQNKGYEVEQLYSNN